MFRVEGSTDGVTWVAYAIKGNLLEARESAASCILKTQHTHVRIVEA